MQVLVNLNWGSWAQKKNSRKIFDFDEIDHPPGGPGCVSEKNVLKKKRCNLKNVLITKRCKKKKKKKPLSYKKNVVLKKTL